MCGEYASFRLSRLWVPAGIYFLVKPTAVFSSPVLDIVFFCSCIAPRHVQPVAAEVEIAAPAADASPEPAGPAPIPVEETPIAAVAEEAKAEDSAVVAPSVATAIEAKVDRDEGAKAVEEPAVAVGKEVAEAGE